MRCPTLSELPSPPPGKTGWPWTEDSAQLPDTMPDPSTPRQARDVAGSGQAAPWPRVSIVTPSYNQGQFIEESIRSVLLQGYPDLEYIIIDGGSTDSSVEIIRKYEPWLAYWVSEPDRGQSHAINKGLERSTGQLFNWHNSDDVLTPNSLAITVAAMVNHPDASYVHGYNIAIDSQSHILSHINNHPILTETGVVLDPAWSVSNLKCGGQPGCLMDRDLVVELGGVDESLQFIMDLDLTLRLILIRPPLYVHHPVVYFRLHPKSKGSSRHAQQRAKARLIIAHKLFSRRDLPPEIRKLRRRAFATAHQYAWRNYAEANMYLFALWHVLQDIFCSSRRNWGARRAILRMAARQILSGFTRRTLRPIMRIRRRIGQQMANVQEAIQFQRHRMYLKQQVLQHSKEYQEYLDTQLRRTLSKKDTSLKVGARRLIDKTAELVDLTRCDVLCIGCRNTAEIDYFRNKGARSVVGIDLFSESSDILVMDMHRMTFPDDRFDIIYASHSLEHAYDVQKVVDEILRVARPGALVAIEVPVQYEARGTDLVDFGNLRNLHAVFEPHIAQVLWSDEQPPHTTENDSGTAVIRTVFSIRKDG